MFFRGLGLDPYQLPAGSIVAFCDLVDCVRAEDIRDSLSSLELAFGNYNDRRFVYVLDNIRRPSTPIPWKGHQWMFDMEIDLEAICLL
jgi:hypothetical protein